MEPNQNAVHSWVIMLVANPGWNMTYFQDVLDSMMGHMYVLVGTFQMEGLDVTEAQGLLDIRVPAADPLMALHAQLHKWQHLYIPAQIVEHFPVAHV